MDQLALPCAGWWSLQVVGLRIDGRLLQLKASAGSILTPTTPVEIAIRPNETWEGLLDLKSVYPIDTNPRDRDVLLLWSYSYQKRTYTGVTLLPMRHG